MANYDHLTPDDCDYVQLDWLDIQEFTQWNEVEDVVPRQALDRGWLLANTRTEMVLAGGYLPTEERWTGVMIIPTKRPKVTVLWPASNTG